MNKGEVREEFGFGRERIGIFAGDFSEVNGWSKIRTCIEGHPEITGFWFLKPSAVYLRQCENIIIRYPRSVCETFELCGFLYQRCKRGPVQAAIEACLCDLPLIMPRAGIFQILVQKSWHSAVSLEKISRRLCKNFPNAFFSPGK